MDHVIKVYRVPNEVVARMGPLAEPGKSPAKATGFGGSAGADVLKFAVCAGVAAARVSDEHQTARSPVAAAN